MKITVSNPVLDLSEKNVKAKLDTGADMTTIPEELAQRLKLVHAPPQWFRGFDDEHPIKKPTHYVNVELNGFPFRGVRVTYGNEVLVGRDILNQLEIHLYGKSLTFDVKDS